MHYTKQSPGTSSNDHAPHLKQEEVLLLEPRFRQLKEDLAFMFNIEVTSEASLKYPWVKDELFSKVVAGLTNDEYFALDFMANEELHGGEPLLSKEDFIRRGIRSYQDHARTILHKYKGQHLANVKQLFTLSGIMTEEEIVQALTLHQHNPSTQMEKTT